MEQAIRNRLRSVVTQSRKLLEDITAQALQGRFGIYAARKKGEVQIEDEARMAPIYYYPNVDLTKPWVTWRTYGEIGGTSFFLWKMDWEAKKAGLGM